MTRDLRRFARQTNLRLLLGFIGLLFFVGEGLIYFVYGREAALFGFICLFAGLLPLILIALSLWLMEKLVDRTQNN